jgi:hypothetical protein
MSASVSTARISETPSANKMISPTPRIGLAEQVYEINKE